MGIIFKKTIILLVLFFSSTILLAQNNQDTLVKSPSIPIKPTEPLSVKSNNAKSNDVKTPTSPTKKNIGLFSGTGTQIPFANLSLTNPENGKQIALSLRLLLFLSILTLAPSLIMLMTSFLRMFLVFDFIRRALSLQQVPPTQVLAGISLFLTLFVMWPIFSNIYEKAYIPLSKDEITLQEAYKEFEKPLRLFMYKQLDGDYKQIQLLMSLAELNEPANLSEVPTYVMIPAFVLHELKTAFTIGIIIYLPFIVVDMIVASVLMSMGMIMLPPIMISLPFKLILFVLVDGWNLIVEQLIKGFFV